MTPGRDDDALTWDGDDDPTMNVSHQADVADETDGSADVTGETARLPDGFTAVGKGSDGVGTGSAEVSPEESDARARPIGSAALVGVGIFAGIYLLLSLGWLLGTARLQLVAALFLEPIAFQASIWLAVLALPLWFVSVLWLARSSATWLRFTLLAAGAILLIPWPFVLGGALL